MCGITIFVSKTNIVQHILQSLKQIQNRGYDSVGIALKSNTLAKFDIYKYASTETQDGLTLLSDKINDMTSCIAIGHTRWATHGAKNDVNSHPHISMSRYIILVHNGIITNFQEIKNFLIEKNYCFYSETDTEVIANLIEFYLLETNHESIITAIELATKKMCGTWALGIIYTQDIDKIYVTRHGSPLLLGYNDNMIICSSEIAGFGGLIYNYIVLQNKDIITIGTDGYTSNKSYTMKTLQKQIDENSPSPFIHWTLKEIYEQPKSIQSAFNNGARIIDNDIKLGGLNILKNTLVSNKIEHIILLGCGTSYHACMIAKYYFDDCLFNTIQAFDASEFSKSDIPKNGKTLCIVCSQSGETRDIILSMEICKQFNCFLLGVINVVDSFIAQMVDCGVYINAGREVAVASTKSFTSMLVVLSLIAMWFKEKHMNIPILNSLRIMPNIIEQLLISECFKNKCKEIVNFINSHKIKSIFVLGHGKMFPISREIALKIKELTYIHAEGYSSKSLKHGPFALLDKNTLTFLLIDKNTDNLSTYYEITSRDTHCYIVSDCDDIFNTGEINNIMLPKIKYYQEIIFTVALQYLSYELSISRNINPDKPRNLAKVVTVE